MPRGARTLSPTGVYHVMLRGINKQRIFEGAEDYIKFLEVLGECKQISGFSLYAYCLMSNHIHLLIKEGPEPLKQIFKRIGARYVYWYNWKYKRNGHLFQDRFKSEPVYDDRYLLTVARYIHQNPVKAGICDDISQYPYSSYKHYIQSEGSRLIDIDFILDMIGRDEFIKFSNMNNNDNCLELAEKTFRLSDEELSDLMYEVTKCKNTTEFQKLDATARDRYIRKLKERGMSIREISRITGVSIGIVRKNG